MGYIKRRNPAKKRTMRRRGLRQRVLRNSNVDSIKERFEGRRDELLKGKFKKLSWTHTRDRNGRRVPQEEYQENVLMMGPMVNSTGAPVHIGLYEDRMVVVKIIKAPTIMAYDNVPMMAEFDRALNIERMAPGISTPHIALGAPYPVKKTKTTQVMMIMEYRLCSLGDFLKELAKEPSEEIKKEFLKRISVMGFDLLDQLITKTKYVHVDIKPDNILVTFAPDGSFKLELTDFGMTTQSGILSLYPGGTPFYSAREQQSPVKKDRRITWLWDLEGWVLSVVGMAADLGLIPQQAYKQPDLKVKDYHRLKVEFFNNIPDDIGFLKPLVTEAERIISENPSSGRASQYYERMKSLLM